MSCELVAEISSNHLGKLDRALTLIDAAADAGASSVKFQCWTPDTMARDPEQRIGVGLWAGKTLGTLYRECWTPWDWFPALVVKARRRGLAWFASVFDAGALQFLTALGCPRYKISSFELTDLVLIRAVAETNKPIILSMGMSNETERIAAIRAAAGCAGLTVLHCVSAYPAPLEHMDLAAMEVLKTRAWIKVGLSDHSLGWIAAVCAAALGADMIEKHLTLLRVDGGPDVGFSMEPHEFAEMVGYVRQAEIARGRPRYDAAPSEVPYIALRRGPRGRG